MAWGTPFKPFNTLYPVMPPVLRIQPRDVDEPYIHLHPAHPSHALRWAFLKDRAEKCIDFGILTAFLWQWTQSWNLSHFSQTTCALLVINFLQVRCHEYYLVFGLTVSQRKYGASFSESSHPSSSLWISLESNTKRDYYRIDVPDASLSPGRVENKTVVLLCQLLE